MNRVALKFQELRQANRKALIPYLMGGDPDLATTVRMVQLLAEAGADLIEVGVPFSDPLADGAVIQAAGQRSLSNGTTLAGLLEALQPVTSSLAVPIILMLYSNMLLQIGWEQFFEKISAAGCSGLIIPDLPPEAAGEVLARAEKYQIGLNFLVAPTSTPERIEAAAAASTGFLYAVSVRGVTGVRTELSIELPDFINQIKKLTSQPIAVGFGIATPAQAQQVAGLADGVIVGSALVKAMAVDSSLKTARELFLSLRAVV